MSDRLIDRLVADLKPVPSHAVPKRLLLAVMAGLIVAIPLMMIMLGFRSDMRNAAGTAMFWIKAGYTGGLALLGFWIVDQAGKPGLRGTVPIRLAAGLAGITGLAAIVNYALASPEVRPTILMGSSALVCPFYIVALSAPFFVTCSVLMRKLAPTDLPLAGAATGLLAGALGAWIYSLHCTEDGLPFLAVWYSLGILAVTAIGAALGPRILRW